MLGSLVATLLVSRVLAQDSSIFKMYRYKVGDVLRTGLSDSNPIVGQSIVAVDTVPDVASLQAQALDAEEKYMVDDDDADTETEDLKSIQRIDAKLAQFEISGKVKRIHRGCWAKVVAVQTVTDKTPADEDRVRQLQQITLTSGAQKGKTFWICRDYDLRWPLLTGDMGFSLGRTPVAFDLEEMKQFDEAVSNHDTTLMASLESLDRVYRLSKDEMVLITERNGDYVHIEVVDGSMKLRKGWMDMSLVSGLLSSDLGK